MESGAGEEKKKKLKKKKAKPKPAPQGAVVPPKASAEPSAEPESKQSLPPVQPEHPKPAGAPDAKGASEEPDAKEFTSKDYYFDSYAHFGIHEEMLKDDVRMKTYSRAILNSKHLFKDKVVLDVGCGTGILCMFAARAGAKRVIGVEMATIHHQARKIIAANGFADVITIVGGKIEDVELPVEKVDIIISEWMGYFLLYESMLDTVLFARDKWLAPGGLLFPDKASLFIAAIEDANYRRDKIDFWDDVYGFNMSCIKELALMEPLVDVCEPDQMISTASKILDIDLYTVTKEDLDFESKFEVHLTRSDFVHALVSYFNVEFSKTHTKINFSTSPRAQYTHWKQTVFYLEEPVVANKGETLEGVINVKRNVKNPRDLDIQLTTKLRGKHINHQASRLYRLR
jgi:protein arginine N-methyltransferase 1